SWLTPVWGDLSRAVEHLSALRAGRLVRAGGQTSFARPGLPHPVCGRLRDWFYPRRRRAPGAGGSAAAIRQVRLDDPSSQDPPRPFSAAVSDGVGKGHRVGHPAWDVYPVGLYALLGAFPAWVLGGE